MWLSMHGTMSCKLKLNSPPSFPVVLHNSEMLIVMVSLEGSFLITFTGAVSTNETGLLLGLSRHCFS
jgi:hypothetical protein